jgi:hypothetical protein
MNTEPLRAHTSLTTHPPSLDPSKDAELDGSENIATMTTVAAAVGVIAGGAGWFGEIVGKSGSHCPTARTAGSCLAN